MKEIFMTLIILIDGIVIGFNLQLLQELRDIRYKEETLKKNGEKNE